MSLTIRTLIDALVSHASAAGFFDSVNGHEPKSAPGDGLTYSVWVQQIGPATGASVLAATAARVAMTGRLYKPFRSQPDDSIDPDMVDALDALLAAYSGDFTLGGTIRNVDLLGAHGEPLGMRAGYQTIDKTVYRILDITIPMIISDAWTQEA